MGFFWGAIIGGTIVWLWGRDMREGIGTRTHGLRSRAAGTLHDVADRLHAAGDTIEGGLSEAPPPSQQRAG